MTLLIFCGRDKDVERIHALERTSYEGHYYVDRYAELILKKLTLSGLRAHLANTLVAWKSSPRWARAKPVSWWIWDRIIEFGSDAQLLTVMTSRHPTCFRLRARMPDDRKSQIDITPKIHAEIETILYAPFFDYVLRKWLMSERCIVDVQSRTFAVRDDVPCPRLPALIAVIEDEMEVPRTADEDAWLRELKTVTGDAIELGKEHEGSELLFAYVNQERSKSAPFVLRALVERERMQQVIQEVMSSSR